mgnify:CR=1 FL=1
MIAGKVARRILSSARIGRSKDNVVRCREKFLRFFPKGFEDQKYLAWERGYKWQAHERWNVQLNRPEYESLLEKQEFIEIAGRAVKVWTLGRNGGPAAEKAVEGFDAPGRDGFRLHRSAEKAHISQT